MTSERYAVTWFSSLAFERARETDPEVWVTETPNAQHRRHLPTLERAQEVARLWAASPDNFFCSCQITRQERDDRHGFWTNDDEFGTQTVEAS